jgi:protein tyrosine phosphatase (PTP) superfamily phosphohydrolase (DUF442 family)
MSTATVSNYTFKKIVIFCFFGLSLVFPLGLLMLTVGPTRIIAEKAAAEHWHESNESLVQKITVVLFLGLVLLLTLLIMRFFNSSKSSITKKGLLLFSGIALVSSLYIFSFQPELLINSDTTETNINTSKNTEFHFGSYPDKEKIKELKAQNYTAIISLLSEMVVPAEPILIEEEIENTKDAEMKLISIPMLPWIDDNDSSVLKIKEIAHNSKGKYYVHCYLGKDRANVFKNIIENENSALQIKSELGSNNIDTLKSFERGKILKLQQHIYFTPYPTDDEFFGFILTGKIKNVVSIMDPKLNNDLIQKETKIMKRYNQKFHSLPISETVSDKKIESIIDSILKLKQPVLVHSYSVTSVPSERFIKLFRSKSKK